MLFIWTKKATTFEIHNYGGNFYKNVLAELSAMRISAFVCVSLTLSLLGVVTGVAMVIVFGHIYVTRNMRSDDFQETICQVTAIRQLHFNVTPVNEIATNFPVSNEHTIHNDIQVTNHTFAHATENSATYNRCISVEVRYFTKPSITDKNGSQETKSAILYSDFINFMNRHTLKKVNICIQQLFL